MEGQTPTPPTSVEKKTGRHTKSEEIFLPRVEPEIIWVEKRGGGEEGKENLITLQRRREKESFRVRKMEGGEKPS